MTDQPPQTQQQPASAPPAKDVPLSDHAEDVLADAVGHELELSVTDQDPPSLTVQQVLSEMGDNIDDIAIALEYGTGQSGVDQATWDIEVTTLQRAYMRNMRAKEVDGLSAQIDTQIQATRTRIDADWVDRTLDILSLSKKFKQAYVTRQEIDDFQHSIFGRGDYCEYLEKVLQGTDAKMLLNAAGNLTQVTRQLQEDYEDLVDPAKVDNTALAAEIAAMKGDIDSLSLELERDFSSAVFRRNLTRAQRFIEVINPDFIKDYKLWAHSFDLNIREVIATEKSATNGRISDKSRDQLYDMLQVGESKIEAITEVIQ